jgi:FLVCR family MFS transporter
MCQIQSAWAKRWFVLSTYTLFAAVQTMQFAIPGVIPITMSTVNGLSNSSIVLFVNYGCIFFVLFAIPFMWTLDRHGIRPAVFIGIFCVLVSAVLRCMANDSSTTSVVFIHLSYMLNGMAGPVAMAVPSRLAADWFPAEERTTATAGTRLPWRFPCLLILATIYHIHFTSMLSLFLSLSHARTHTQILHMKFNPIVHELAVLIITH